MENGFSIGGREFKLNKLDAFKQFHIVRRIGPILTDLLPSLQEAQKLQGKNLTESEQLEVIAKIGSPIMKGLSKLSDADADLVLYGLLSSVEVKQVSGNWAKVAAASPPMLMMQDLDLPILLQIAGRAFVYNLSGFFAGLPAK